MTILETSAAYDITVATAISAASQGSSSPGVPFVQPGSRVCGCSKVDASSRGAAEARQRTHRRGRHTSRASATVLPCPHLVRATRNGVALAPADGTPSKPAHTLAGNAHLTQSGEVSAVTPFAVKQYTAPGFDGRTIVPSVVGRTAAATLKWGLPGTGSKRHARRRRRRGRSAVPRLARSEVMPVEGRGCARRDRGTRRHARVPPGRCGRWW